MGDVSINKSLASFYRMKEEIGGQLSRLLGFTWKLYKRNKQRKEKEEEARKAKAKAAKAKKKKGRNSQAMKNVQSRQGSFVGKSASSASTTSAAKSSSVKKPAGSKKLTDSDQKTKEESPSAVGDGLLTVTDAEKDIKAEAAMDMAIGKLGAFGMMGKGIMQTVPEEINSPPEGSDNDDLDR